MILDKTTRCLRLVHLLQSHVTKRTQDIASEVGVCKRTIYRYYRVLEDAGIPIRYDAEQGGHIIDHLFDLKAATFLDDEIIALLIGAQLSANIIGQEFGSTVNQAISKLLTHLPNRVREESANLSKACVVDLPGLLHLNGSQKVHGVIIKAIRKRLRVRITFGTTDDSSRTCLSPYRLIASQDGWSVVGRSSLHRKVLRFDLKQIRHAELTDDSYRLPYRFRRCTPPVQMRNDSAEPDMPQCEMCGAAGYSAAQSSLANGQSFFHPTLHGR
jgi:predicted DNA-binding transcriptional regulator YafY